MHSAVSFKVEHNKRESQLNSRNHEIFWMCYFLGFFLEELRLFKGKVSGICVTHCLKIQPTHTPIRHTIYKGIMLQFSHEYSAPRDKRVKLPRVSQPECLLFLIHKTLAFPDILLMLTGLSHFSREAFRGFQGCYIYSQKSKWAPTWSVQVVRNMRL